MTPSLRAPRTPLVTRLLAALTVVLALSLLITSLVESSLTRSAVRAQAESVLDQRVAQARAVLLQDVQDILVELQYVKSSFRRSSLPDGGGLDPGDPEALADVLSDVQERRRFTSIGAYDASGAPIQATFGPALVAPPDQLLRRPDRATMGARVVETVDGRHAYVAGELVPGGADGDVLVMFGFLFDTAYARSVRNATGGDDILLLVDGTAVGGSLPGQPENLDAVGREAGGIELVESGDRIYWSRLEDVVRPGDGWGEPAQFAVLTPEPLAHLDAALVRNRLVAGGALLVIATLLAWLVSRRLTRPLRELTATAAAIADGNRDAVFTATSDDEVGVLAQSLEEMRQGLGRQLVLIQRQAEALRDAGGRLVHAQDEARRRLAADLHDGVQRQLVMLRLHLGFGRERIRQSPGEAEAVVDELAAEIDQVLARLRETAQGIYPSILRDRGLEGALFSLAARSPLPVELDVDPEPLPRLPHEVEANAYFLVSEAVTNVIKHAGATRVAIRLRLDGDLLELRVGDDGEGFSPVEDRSTAGRGLGTMEDRARALRGTVDVSTSSDGTEVVARLPVAGSLAGALEEEQHRRDTSVHLEVLAEPELPEDGVDVLLDGPLGDVEVSPDRPVALPGRHEREDVELPGGQPREP